MLSQYFFIFSPLLILTHDRHLKLQGESNKFAEYSVILLTALLRYYRKMHTHRKKGENVHSMTVLIEKKNAWFYKMTLL